MNVTSLLNTSGGAQATRRRLPSYPGAVGGYETEERMVPLDMSSDARLPNRNRTPWDAGGYSLPLTLNIKNSQQHILAPRSTFYSDLPAAGSTGPTSPKSPNHRLSNSHSSLSSYTAMSLNSPDRSRSHSRISSLSTVSEYQALNTFVSDTAPRERVTSDMDSEVLFPTVVEAQSPPYFSRRSNESVLVNRHSSRQPDPPQSPSDGILARYRGATGSASPTDSTIINYFLPADPSSKSLSTSTSTWTSRAHTRTVSAPSFHPSTHPTSSSRRYRASRPMAEPSPPVSPQGENGQQSVDSNNSPPSAPVLQAQNPGTATAPQNGPAPPVYQCLYCTPPEVPCNFHDSPLRKLISHIFGRNKLCTKAIPDHIWVHYCRKHYQRARYRDISAYALRQIAMVVAQIQMIQDWSDENVRANRRGDGVLKHWTLQARRREAMRLQTASRKRQLGGDNNVTLNDDDEDLAATAAIPEWLQIRLNQQYNSVQMKQIAEEIQAHMRDTEDELTQIPDIEILPEIMTEKNNARTPKSKSRQAGSGHGQSRSETSASSGPSSQDPKRARTGASPFGTHDMNQALPHRENNASTSNAQVQASTNAWIPALFGDGMNSHHVLPTPIPQYLVDTHNIGGQQPFFAQGHSNTSGGAQSSQPQGRSHARSVSDLSYSYHNHPSQQALRYQQQSQAYQQQQGSFSNYDFSTGYGQGTTTNQGYGTNTNANTNTNTNGNGYASNASNLGPSAFTSGSPGMPQGIRNSSFQQTSVQQQQSTASFAGGRQSSNSMPTTGNTNTAQPTFMNFAEYHARYLVSPPRTRVPPADTAPRPHISLDEYYAVHAAPRTQPTNAPHQNSGQQSTSQEGNLNSIEPPQQSGTQHSSDGGYNYSQQPDPRY